MLSSSRCAMCYLVICLSVLVGCEKDSAPPAVVAAEPASIQIAVCDLDKIANELGYIDQLNQILTRQQTLLGNEIRKLDATGQAAINEKLEAVGEFPDDEQKRELAILQSQARQLVLQSQNRARQDFARMRANLVQQIRTKIKKPVDQVATKKGINIVISDRAESVLFTASAANITSEVLSAARNANLGKLELGESDGGRETPGNRSESSELREKKTEGPLESSDPAKESSLFNQ
ncbi:MAG: OmpH family outer membrane protein [Pirellulales bacterium]|nr:OmpH family outer membrane protein [Pirellulales bacterium]